MKIRSLVLGVMMVGVMMLSADGRKINPNCRAMRMGGLHNLSACGGATGTTGCMSGCICCGQAQCLQKP